MDLKTALPIVLAILVMASFFLTWLSTKTWRAAHVTFVMLVFLTSLVFWYLAAATLKVHKTYREQANALQAQLEQAEKIALALKQGTNDQATLQELQRQEIQLVSGGIRSLQQELAQLLQGRGRVWVDADPGAPGEDGTVTLTVAESHGVNQDMVLQVFQQGSVTDGARYLGEFKVTAVAEEEVTLQPTMVMTDRQRQQLQGAEGPWTLYELMPLDRTDVLAGLSEAQLEAIFPAQSVAEYKKDGKPADPDDPQQRIQMYNDQPRYARALRDYETLFHELYRQRYVDRNLYEQRQHDQALLADAIASAKKDIEYRTQEIEKLKTDKVGIQRDLEVVKAHLERLNRVYEGLNGRLQASMSRTTELAQELSTTQTQLAAEIETRLNSMTASETRPIAAATLASP